MAGRVVVVRMVQLEESKGGRLVVMVWTVEGGRGKGTRCKEGLVVPFSAIFSISLIVVISL